MTPYSHGHGLRILLVDDHDIVREGLAMVIQGFPDVAALDEARNGQEALVCLSRNLYHLLVTDIQMPIMNGLELIEKARQEYQDLCIVALTVDGQAATVADALQAGANAYLLKNSGKSLLFRAIAEALEGRTYVDQELSSDLIHYIRTGKAFKEVAVLSPRELEILKRIAAEQNNQMIADQLFISERTVETHRKNIFRKTDTKSLVGLILYAKDKGLI